MDEPTTHLDMASVEALIDALRGFEGTICCISHDLYFLNALADHVVHVDHGKITVYPGNYDYFKHRQAQWHEENPQAVSVPKLEKEPLPDKDKSRKRNPRQEAKLLGELEALHASLESLAAQLADPELYADYAKVQEIGEQMERVQAEIQVKEAEITD
jgi:ATP-binding cassette subfamily F protein 3